MTLENTLINDENKLKENLVAKKECKKFQTEKLNGSIIHSKANFIWEKVHIEDFKLDLSI